MNRRFCPDLLRQFPLVNVRYQLPMSKISLPLLANRYISPCLVLDMNNESSLRPTSGSRRSCEELPTSREKTIGEARFTCMGSVTSVESIRVISCSSNSLAFGPARYGAKWPGWISVSSSSIRFCSALIQWRCSPHILSRCVNMLMYLSLYAEYSSASVGYLRQSVSENSSNWLYSVVAVQLLFAALGWLISNGIDSRIWITSVALLLYRALIL